MTGGYRLKDLVDVKSRTIRMSIRLNPAGLRTTRRVGDTIQFLMRFRLESMKTDDRTLALRRTFDYAGRAILMTTMILALGFLPMAFSGYSTTRMFGTLLPAVLVVALLADLLFVPALVQVGWIRFKRSAREETTSSSP